MKVITFRFMLMIGLPQLLCCPLLGQQFYNPSFEKKEQFGVIPWPWQYYEEQSTPDLQPGLFHVTRPAYHGKYYAGLVYRSDSTTEYLGQYLPRVLEANSYYEFSCMLAYSDEYHPNGGKPATIRVLGINNGVEPYVLWHSPLISSTSWRKYIVRFETPDYALHSLFFQAYYGRPEDKEGSILLDDIGRIEKLIAPIAPNLGKDTILCEGETLTLFAPSDTSHIEWQDGSQKRSFTVKEPGLYWVSSRIGVITRRDTIEVRYGYLPKIDLGEDSILCQSQKLELQIPNLIREVQFAWNTGDTLSGIQVHETGTYKVLASNGRCLRSDSISVVFRDCNLILEMPNVLSPNGDGINDTFVPIKIKDVYTPKLLIYDRWGKQMYASARVDSGWNGEAPYGPAKEGVYFWILHYQDIFGNEFVDKGSLSLMR